MVLRLQLSLWSANLASREGRVKCSARGAGRAHRATNSQAHGYVTRHRHLPSHSGRMTRKVSLAEARDHLTGLVRDVERGQSIELTRRGKPVAVLVSREEYTRLRAKRPSLDQALHAWRARLPAEFEGFSDDEVRSWRDGSPGREVRFG